MKGNIGPTADTGRPGGAVTTRGDAAPASSPSLPPAGYEPTALDETIRSHIAACQKAVRIADTIGNRVETAVNDLVTQIAGTPEEKAELLTKLHERLSKATLNLVKSTDELTRLRSFLAGGPDRREDITVKGELDIRVQLLAAITQLGWRVVDGDGRDIVVEAA